VCEPAVVDVLVPGLRKDGAAFDMFGDMQSPVNHTEEQFSTQLASQGSTLGCLCISVGKGAW